MLEFMKPYSPEFRASPLGNVAFRAVVFEDTFPPGIVVFSLGTVAF